MTFDPTKPVQTRGGKKLIRGPEKIKNNSYPYFALVESDSGDVWPVTFAENGQEFEGHQSSNDLVNVPEEQFVWVNVYKCVNESLYCSFSHASRKEADDGSSSVRVGRLKIKLVEGQWDD